VTTRLTSATYSSSGVLFRTEHSSIRSAQSSSALIALLEIKIGVTVGIEEAGTFCPAEIERSACVDGESIRMPGRSSRPGGRPMIRTNSELAPRCARRIRDWG